MKKLATTILASLAIVANVSAGLTPEQFGKMRNWAEREGYSYTGIRTDSAGIEVYMFRNAASLAVAPTSSDTPDEGINALIASASMFRVSSAVNEEAKERAYKQGFQDGVQHNNGEDAYRRGYIDGSRLRGSYVGDRQPE
jgi:hypothetical protein